MTRKYWLDLFTGTTWEEFLEHGAKISGFRASRERLAERISPGDYLLCYLTGISRFIGILEVKSKCYEDATPIWKAGIFAAPAHIEGLGPGRLPDILRRRLSAQVYVPGEFASSAGSDWQQPACFDLNCTACSAAGLEDIETECSSSR